MNTIAIPDRQNLTKSIVVMAGVYSGQFDCEIIINDRGEASTDGKIINIPKPTPEFLDVTWGYAAHECGHIRDSDNALVIQTKTNDWILGWLLNVIEDTRIEAVMISHFPGVKKYFMALSEKVLTYQPQPDNVDMLADYIFYYIRGKLTGYPIWDDAVLQLEKELIGQTSVFFIDGIQKQMDATLALDSTESALALAKELVEYIRKAPEDFPPNTSNNGNGGGSGENSNPSEINQKSQDSNDMEEGQSDESNDGKEQGSETQDSKSGSDESKPDPNSQSESGKGLKEVTEAFLNGDQTNRREGDLGKTLEKVLNKPENQEAMTPEERCNTGTGEVKSISVSNMEAESFESFARQSTTQLRHSLIKLMETKTRTQRVTTRRGRRLSRSKLNRLASGNTRIFKRKFQEREDVSSDVVVLADVSGSMKRNLDDVKVATFALLDCLNQIEGAQTCAYSFGCDAIHRIQSPGENFSASVKGRIASLNASGGTPAAQAYWAAVHSLTTMNSIQKVVIMVTDGGPDDVVATQNMVKLLHANNVQVICIGVGVDSSTVSILNHIYGNNGWLEVKQFNDLSSELLRVAKEII